jgi:hypothetical protein
VEKKKQQKEEREHTQTNTVRSEVEREEMKQTEIWN